MEQPPGTSLDDIQSQDLPNTSSIPTVLNLTRSSEEFTLKANSLEAGRMVKSPSWYSNSVSSGSLPFSEAASTDHRQPLADHIQQDNAFSNTTVTLSYVSRSHVFSTQDSLSQLSPRYGVPPISKFSLHSGSLDSEKGVQDTDRAHFCMERNSHYLEQVGKSRDLASQTELFVSFPQAQLGEDVCQTKEPHEFNGGFVCSDGRVTKPKAQHAGINTSCFQNGQDNIWLGPGVEPLEPLIAHSDEEESTGGDSGVLFLISKTEEPVITPDIISSSDLCSLNGEYISTLVDPMSPSTTCLEDVEDVFMLPQASNSPSADDSCVGEASDAAWEADKSAPSSPHRTMSGSGGPPRLDGSSRQRRRKDILEPIIDLTEDLTFLSESFGNESKKTTTAHLNGNATVVQTTLETRKLPARPGRGTRLEAIVMNIHPGRYRAAHGISTNKSAKASPTSNSTFNAVSSKDTSFVLNNKGNNKATHSLKNPKPHAASPPVKRDQDNGIDKTCCIESTSDSKLGSYSKKQDAIPLKPEGLQPVLTRPQPNSTFQNKPSANVVRVSSPQKCIVKVSSVLKASSVLSSSQKAAEIVVSPPKYSENLTSPQESVARESTPPSVFQKKSPAKPKTTATGSKGPPTAKSNAEPAPKRKRKKYKPSQPSTMFAPPEPEIKLKYVNYKEERREQRADTFSPFVRLQPKGPSLSLCTVVNDPEDEQPRLKKGQPSQGGSGGFIPGATPSTSCLQPGRLSSHSLYHSSLVCCLCGKSANAMDLGDLHGPYYPEGYRPSAKTQASIAGHHNKEEEENDEECYSDSDSSCNMKGRGGKSVRLPGMWHHSATPRLNQQGLLRKHCRWAGDGELTGSLAAKRARPEAGVEAAAAAIQDWYSAPVVPLEPCEYWLHEDCGIWSADVFLVKGKVYGLEEAVKMAQETMCSGCHNAGATLGCFFKGCPNKYHYRCALQSDCVLVEENFTMKCKKHKNKSFNGPPLSRRDNR